MGLRTRFCPWRQVRRIAGVFRSSRVRSGLEPDPAEAVRNQRANAD